MNKQAITDVFTTLSEKYNIDNYKPKLIMTIFCLFIFFIIGIILIWLGSGCFKQDYRMIYKNGSIACLVIGLILALGAIFTMIFAVIKIYAFATFARYLQTAIAALYAGNKLPLLLIELKKDIGEDIQVAFNALPNENKQALPDNLSGQSKFEWCINIYNQTLQ